MNMLNAFLTTSPDIFGKIAKKFPIDVQMWWQRFYSQLFSSEDPYGHVEYRFWQTRFKKFQRKTD